MFSVRPAARSEHATETALFTASLWVVPAAELHIVLPWNSTQSSQLTFARPIVEYTMNIRSATNPAPIRILVDLDILVSIGPTSLMAAPYRACIRSRSCQIASVRRPRSASPIGRSINRKRPLYSRPVPPRLELELVDPQQRAPFRRNLLW